MRKATPIETAEGCERALQRAAELMDEPDGSLTSDERDTLAIDVEAYQLRARRRKPRGPTRMVKGPRPAVLLLKVKWLRGNEVRLLSSTGRLVDVALPVASAKKARIVAKGMGLDPGDGRDMCAETIHWRATRRSGTTRRQTAPARRTVG